ncbi:OB-fold protein [Vulcaniibacterium tengchongense]|uniref:Putative nucleic acid binding protein n=1 Tax=Vulcaniibacterium tengchongense TaxID=1273429 RepID=A0A3N4VL85_9GAMM|nr:hypothetical protein [Vulcaniibacterium tengchongense]RPE74640.1 putative nucleic acid binding protein [Vulcaniibacterium tengchongense]
MNATASINTTPRSAPVKATWVCLIVAWILFLLPLPGVGVFVGWPLNLVAFILAIVVMARGFTKQGLLPLLASLIVSPIVYFIGLAVLGATAVGGTAALQQASNGTETAAPASQAEPAADAIKITARELFQAYAANEVAADGKYKGKALEVSGKVESITSDFSDEAVVQLTTGEILQQVHARGLPKDVAAQLETGQQVTVACTGAGEVMGSPQLNDCRVK